MVLFKLKANAIHFQSFKQAKQQGLRVGRVRGYFAIPSLLESGISIAEVTTDEQLFRMLARRRVDLVAADLLNGQHVLQTFLPQHAPGIDWISPPLESRPQYLVLSRHYPGTEALMEKFNLGLSQLRQSGDYQIIINTLLPISYQQLLQE